MPNPSDIQGIRRVNGPYKHRNRWRIIVVDRGGGQHPFSYETEAQARQVKRSLTRAMQAEGVTVSDALVAYERHLTEKGNAAEGVKTTLFRLNALLTDSDDDIAKLTSRRAHSLYERFKRSNTRLNRPPSVATRLGTLGQAKTFAKWCIKKGWLRSNPFDGIEDEGRRNAGKKQLRVSEARRFIQAAVKQATTPPKRANSKTDKAAIAALLTLYLGVRASEVLDRVARDFDDDARLLWIDHGKTDLARRVLIIPEVLRPLVLSALVGKKPDDRVFAGGKDWLLDNVKRLCRTANVPEVCTHSMRGLHASLAAEMGVTPEIIASALGHSSFDGVTKRHYAQAGSIARGNQQRAFTTLSFDEGRRRG